MNKAIPIVANLRNACDAQHSEIFAQRCFRVAVVVEAGARLELDTALLRVSAIGLCLARSLILVVVVVKRPKAFAVLVLLGKRSVFHNRVARIERSVLDVNVSLCASFVCFFFKKIHQKKKKKVEIETSFTSKDFSIVGVANSQHKLVALAQCHRIEHFKSKRVFHTKSIDTTRKFRAFYLKITKKKTEN